MKRYLYSETGISFRSANVRQIADLVLRGILEPDSSIQDEDTQAWVKIRNVKQIMDIIMEPDIKLNFAEPDMDTYLESGRTSMFYNMSPLAFWLMMLGTMGMFVFYWSYRNWAYIHSKQKRRSILSKILDVFSFISLFDTISRDGEMRETFPSRFDSSKQAWMVYAMLAAPHIAAQFFVSMPYAFNSLVSYLLVIALIFVCMPIVKYIHEVNLKRRLTTSSIDYLFFIMLIYAIYVTGFGLFNFVRHVF